MTKSAIAWTPGKDEFCSLVGAVEDLRKSINRLRVLALDVETFSDIYEGVLHRPSMRRLRRELEKAVALRDLAHMRVSNIAIATEGGAS